MYQRRFKITPFKTLRFLSRSFCTFKKLAKKILGVGLNVFVYSGHLVGLRVAIADINAIGHNIGDSLNFAINTEEDLFFRRGLIFHSELTHCNSLIPAYQSALAEHFPKTNFVMIPEWCHKFLKQALTFSRSPALSEFSGVSGTFADSAYLTPKFRDHLERIVAAGQLEKSSEDGKGDGPGRVVVFLRDSSFRGPDQTRDGNLQNLIPTIQWLLREGWIVSRITKSTVEPLEISHPNFRDLSNENYNDALPFAEIQRANFAISNWFGPMELLRLFRVPTVFIDVPPSFMEMPKRGSTSILFKNLVSTGVSDVEGAIIDLIVNQRDPRDESVLGEAGIRLMPCSPGQIKSAVRRFLSEGMLRTHSTCSQCRQIKTRLIEELSGVSPSLGGVRYRFLLSPEDFARIDACIIPPRSYSGR